MNINYDCANYVIKVAKALYIATFLKVAISTSGAILVILVVWMVL